MEEPTDDIPKQGCSKNHDLLSHRQEVVESFLHQMFCVNFETHIKTKGAKWNCCSEDVPPFIWPMLDKITNRVSAPSATLQIGELNAFRPSVIKHKDKHLCSKNENELVTTAVENGSGKDNHVTPNQIPQELNKTTIAEVAPSSDATSVSPTSSESCIEKNLFESSGSIIIRTHSTTSSMSTASSSNEDCTEQPPPPLIDIDEDVSFSSLEESNMNTGETDINMREVQCNDIVVQNRIEISATELTTSQPEISEISEDNSVPVTDNAVPSPPPVVTEQIGDDECQIIDEVSSTKQPEQPVVVSSASGKLKISRKPSVAEPLPGLKMSALSTILPTATAVDLHLQQHQSISGSSNQPPSLLKIALQQKETPKEGKRRGRKPGKRKGSKTQAIQQSRQLRSKSKSKIHDTTDNSESIEEEITTLRQNQVPLSEPENDNRLIQQEVEVDPSSVVETVLSSQSLSCREVEEIDLEESDHHETPALLQNVHSRTIDGRSNSEYSTGPGEPSTSPTGSYTELSSSSFEGQEGVPEESGNFGLESEETGPKEQNVMEQLEVSSPLPASVRPSLTTTFSRVDGDTYEISRSVDNDGSSLTIVDSDSVECHSPVDATKIPPSPQDNSSCNSNVNESAEIETSKTQELQITDNSCSDTPSDEMLVNENPTVLLITDASKAAKAVEVPINDEDSSDIQVVQDTSLETGGTIPNNKPLADLIVAKRACTRDVNYCPVCQQSFLSRELVKEHIRIVHSGDDEGDGEGSEGEETATRRSKRKRRRASWMDSYSTSVTKRREKREVEISQNQSDSEDEGEQQLRQRHRVLKPKILQCPYCNIGGIPRRYRWDHLRRCDLVTPDLLEAEKRMKGKITWKGSNPQSLKNIPAKKQGRPRSHAQQCSKELQVSKTRNAVALTENEGKVLRRQKSGCDGAKTDWNTSDEENAASNTNQASCSRQVDIELNFSTAESEEDRPHAKKLKQSRNPHASTSSAPTVPWPPPKPLSLSCFSDGTIGTDIFESRQLHQVDDNADPTHASTTMKQYRFSGNRSASETEVISSDEEDPDATRVLSLKSDSQASSPTTACSTPRCQSKRGSKRVQCDRCSRTVRKEYLEQHYRSRNCKGKAADTDSNKGYHIDTAAEDSQTEGEETNSSRRPRRTHPVKRIYGLCPYCNTSMLRPSLRNHVLQKICQQAKDAAERGEKLDYHSQTEYEEDDSQTEGEDGFRGSKFKSRGKIECDDCGKLMKETSLRAHRNRCKGPKGRATTSGNGQEEDVNNDSYHREESGLLNELTLSCNGSALPDFEGADHICKYDDCNFLPETIFLHQEHLKKHPPNRGYSCPKRNCDKVFFDRYNLPDHISSHNITLHHDATEVSLRNNPLFQPDLRLNRLAEN